MRSNILIGAIGDRRRGAPEDTRGKRPELSEVGESAVVRRYTNLPRRNRA